MQKRENVRPRCDKGLGPDVGLLKFVRIGGKDTVEGFNGRQLVLLETVRGQDGEVGTDSGSHVAEVLRGVACEVRECFCCLWVGWQGGVRAEKVGAPDLPLWWRLYVTFSGLTSGA